MKLEFSEQIFEKYSNVKFHENPSCGSRVLCGQTDMTKLIVAFRKSANAPKNIKILASGREPAIVIFRGLCCSRYVVWCRSSSPCAWQGRVVTLMKVYILVNVRSWAGIA